jgi:flavodoxin
MNALVVYYSRTGNTRKAGKAIARRLECGEVEIAERKDRTGAGGYFRAGLDAMRRRSTPIEAIDTDIKAVDLVVVGTPVWAFTVAPPVRAFLEQHAGEIGRIAFFCTMGGSGDRRAFRAMEDLAGKAPAAVLALTERDVKGALEERIEPFVAALSAG